MKTALIAVVALMLAACGASDRNVAAVPTPPVAVTPPPITPPPDNPPPVEVTPPTVPTDDTATLQAALDQGGVVKLEARTYHTTAMLNIAVSNPTLEGAGPATKIEFTAPTGATLVSCGNDRVIATNCGFSRSYPLGIASNIAKGATSFEAQNASDVAGLAAGDWLYIAAWDLGIADAAAHTAYATVVDWVQVESVSGTTVNIVGSFRQPFTAAGVFSLQSDGASNGGISFQKVIPLSGIVIENLTVQVDSDINSTNTIAIFVVGTLGTLVHNVTITTPNGRALYAESSKGTTFDGINATGAYLNEFAETVDLTISNSTFKMSKAPAIGLDLGTAFFNVTGNTFTSVVDGIYALYNVHDGSISNNTFLMAPLQNGVLLYGSPNISVTGNNFEGSSTSGSIGIHAAADPHAHIPEPSTGDVQSGNTFAGFSTNTSGL